MKFVAIEKLLHGIPFTSPERGLDLFNLVLDRNPERILELGFAHGVSAGYMAAALDELGRGHMDCVDLEGMDWQKPSIEETLERCGLAAVANIFREKTSYTWFLKKEIEKQTVDGVCAPIYDLIFIDGPKNWTIDGAAFFMAEKLLREGGTIVFDDYGYAYGTVDRVTDGINHRDLGMDELKEAHVKAIFHLLVMQHSSFGHFEVINQQFALARKTKAEIKQFIVREKIGVFPKVLRILRTARRALPKGAARCG